VKLIEFLGTHGEDFNSLYSKYSNYPRFESGLFDNSTEFKAMLGEKFNLSQYEQNTIQIKVTPLTYAIWLNNKVVAKALLRLGANSDTNIVGRWGTRDDFVVVTTARKEAKRLGRLDFPD
jgi:hypothetical protein